MTRAGARAFTTAVIVAALAASSACAKKAPAPPPLAGAPARVSQEDQLRRDIGDIVSDKAVDHAQWSVAVRSLRADDLLYSLNANRLQVPASNQKLLTTAVAADRLGWDFRYATRLFATGPVSADGTLDGDLVVVGDGDPTINPRHPERWGAFDAWAEQLSARGIHRVTGLLIGDDNAFAEPGWGLGWSWDDFVFGYGTPVGALQYNENEVLLTVSAGQEAGAPATIGLTPPGSGLTLDEGVTTVAAGQATSVSIERIPGSPRLSVRGQIAIDAKPVTRTAGIDNPTRMYVNAFREALTRHGISVGGSAVDIDDLAQPPEMARATLLLEDCSAPLGEIIDTCLKWSRNEYAETLLRTLARPERPATAETGLKVLRETLTAWGVPPESYLARDGSGLSRYDWISADAIMAVLARMQRDPVHAEPFRHSQAEAGVSGLMADRLKGTPAEGRVFAKSGSMSQVRSLSGYVTTLDGEPLIFSVIVNGFRVPGTQIDAIVDKVLLRLVTFTRTK